MTHLNVFVLKMSARSEYIEIKFYKCYDEYRSAEWFREREMNSVRSAVFISVVGIDVSYSLRQFLKHPAEGVLRSRLEIPDRDEL